MTTPKPEDTTYKVLRLTTEGYTEVDNINAVNLTKEQCDLALKELVESEGIDPRQLRAVYDS